MTNDKPPKKFGLYAIISVNYSISRVDDISGMRNLKSRVALKYTIYGFSHYFRFAFHCANPQPVFFKQVESPGKINKKSLKFIDGIQYVLQMFQNIFISHRSTVWCGLGS